jgi:ATP-dependent Zn protease
LIVLTEMDGFTGNEGVVVLAPGTPSAAARTT